MDLLEIRDKIDSVDKELVKLFEERMDLCKNVANYKIENQKQVLDPVREKEKIAAIEEFARSEYQQGSGELFRQIMAMSRKMQYKMLAEHGLMKEVAFTEVENIDKTNVKVVYQGV